MTKPPKILMHSIPRNNGFCGLETKHDKRIMARQNIFVSVKRLQEERPQPPKVS
jgi:hypothetical protein